MLSNQHLAQALSISEEYIKTLGGKDYVFNHKHDLSDIGWVIAVVVPELIKEAKK